MTARLPAGDAVPVASIDRAAGVVVTMDGQQLEQGELTTWTVDIHRREGRMHKLSEHAR